MAAVHKCIRLFVTQCFNCISLKKKKGYHGNIFFHDEMLMTLWNSISQDQLTRKRQITSHNSNTLNVFWKKQEEKYFYKKKKTNPHTELQSFICMSPALWAADNVHLSQHFFSLGWTFTGLLLQAFVPGHWHAASASPRELMQSTHTGYIPTKAWQHAGWAALRFLSLPRN